MRWRSSHSQSAVLVLLLAGLLFYTEASLTPEEALGDTVPTFSGKEAREWIDIQCSFGPRVPGTKAHGQLLDRMVSYLDSLGVSYEQQPFKAVSTFSPDTLDVTNLLVSFQRGATPRLLIGAHWDTRPWADSEADSTLHDQPVLGANDGASGTAVLLTLARILHENPPPFGVDLAFFDAEDFGRHEHPEEFCLGSQHMVNNWVGHLPHRVLVLDMVASPQVEFGRELYAWTENPEWVELPFKVAADLGYHEWNLDIEYAVFDDHVPFLARGVQSTVLIGWGYPQWHTLKDRPENTAALSLGRVGHVVLELIYGNYMGAR